MRKLMPVVLLFCLVSLPSRAQKADIFGGYQLTHFDGGPTVLAQREMEKRRSPLV